MSCLGINRGRGWNPDLEESYLPEYSESKAEMYIQCSQRTFLWSVKISSSENFPISRYNKCTKTTSFSILGFFRSEVKLGFDFLGVLPNQKTRPWSLNFDFEEERNPMLG